MAWLFAGQDCLVDFLLSLLLSFFLFVLSLLKEAAMPLPVVIFDVCLVHKTIDFSCASILRR